jgi:hypothetical protein
MPGGDAERAEPDPPAELATDQGQKWPEFVASWPKEL